MTPGKALLVVRAEVPEADRAAFDRWYQDEHLPEAHAAFGSEAAWRGWSAVDPALHYAFYRFADRAQAEAVTRSPAIAGMIAEFDRRWAGRVVRTREVIAAAQVLP